MNYLPNSTYHHQYTPLPTQKQNLKEDPPPPNTLKAFERSVYHMKALHRTPPVVHNLICLPHQTIMLLKFILVKFSLLYSKFLGIIYNKKDLLIKKKIMAICFVKKVRLIL